MRRKDREMDENFAMGVADRCEYAVLSMTDTQGQPYCVPISIVREGRAVYFHCAKAGKKTEAMRKNPRVCIACVGDTRRALHEFTTEYESAVIRGMAEEVMGEEEKIHALRLLCERHVPTNMENFDKELNRSLAVTAVWKVTMDSITGKRKKYDKNGEEMKYGRMEQD